MAQACSFLAVCALLAGCVASGEPDFDEVTSAVLSSNKLAVNGLRANQLGANKLGANSLTHAVLTAPELLDSAEGREVLTYIVSCALEPNAQLVLQRNGGPRYTFFGGLALAPMWRFHIPNQAERRWVTACVLARTNLSGKSVELSLRGAHPRLSPSALEPASFALVEGAFFGDLFAATGPQAFACDAVVRDLDLGLSTQDLRACVLSDDGVTTRCGFSYAGKCAVLDAGLRPACSTAASPYGACRGGANRYDEVITVYLKTAR